MPTYDRHCTYCGAVAIDVIERMADNEPKVCGDCNHDTLVRAVGGSLPGHGRSVNADDIPGGLAMKNGICNADGTPKMFYSRSEIRAACAEKNMIWGPDIDHATSDPRPRERGGRTFDRAKGQVPWRGAPGYIFPEGEAARLAQWLAHEESLKESAK